MSAHSSHPLSFPQHKVRGLSIFNRIMVVIVALSAITTITLFAKTSSRHSEANSLKNDAMKADRQRYELRALQWCEQVTPENADTVADLFKGYDSASSDIKREIDRQCKTRVSIADFIANQDPIRAFTVKPECTLNDTGDGASCTATVTPNSRAVQKRLEEFSSTTLTLRMRIADTHTNLPTQSHTLDDVATLTVDSSGNGTVSFDVPVDASWGIAYDIQVSSFFPNE